VSNRYLDLAAVVRALAEESGQRTVRIVSTADPWLDTQSAWWVLATSDDELIDDRAVKLAATPWSEHDPAPVVWTDQRASLLDVSTRGLVADRWQSAPNLGHFVVDRAGLLTRVDEAQVRTLTRALYSETGGSVPIAVVTTTEMREGAQASAPFEEFAAQLFEQLGMAADESEFGLLIFISMHDRRAAIHIGRSWPTQAREFINRIFVRTAIEGLSAGRASSGIKQSVESLGEFVRSQAQVGRREDE
jgi:hypothetical protein